MKDKDDTLAIDYDKGYVIKYVDEITGKAMYHGADHKMTRVKDSIREKATYTRAGAKKVLANYQRMYPDSGFYSIEKISSHYYDFDEAALNIDNKEKHILGDIDDALNRLDELWDKNAFNNSDKMRINVVRATLNEVKEYLIGTK